MPTPAATAPNPLLVEVRQLIDAARQRVASAVNAELTRLYRRIGHHNSIAISKKPEETIRQDLSLLRHQAAPVHRTCPAETAA